MTVATTGVGTKREPGEKGGLNSLKRSLAGLAALALLGFVTGCPTAPGDPELKKEMEALRSEVNALKEKLGQIEAGQKALLQQLKSLTTAQAMTSADAAGAPAAANQAVPATAAPLTVAELLRNKDKLLGTRVTVRGVPGPVIMHKKTLFLGGPGGMVEVIYGNLQDQKQVERLTSQAIETPITVSGILSAAPSQTKEMVRLTIMADMVEF
jgi:hypothetical protein|uniref:Uncharacterized protein n=1 Tax=Desulfobacca acetoxidans TaxID=60893 RepID=A0A7C5ENC0_9BACT